MGGRLRRSQHVSREIPQQIIQSRNLVLNDEIMRNAFRCVITGVVLILMKRVLPEYRSQDSWDVSKTGIVTEKLQAIYAMFPKHSIREFKQERVGPQWILRLCNMLTTGFGSIETNIF